MQKKKPPINCTLCSCIHNIDFKSARIHWFTDNNDYKNSQLLLTTVNHNGDFATIAKSATCLSTVRS